MQQKPSISLDNRILKRLSAVDLALLKPNLEPVELPVRQVLETLNKPIKHSYFIEYGLASIIAANNHKRIEVGLIGLEGVTGLPIILGNDRSPNETFMQVPGHGTRIAADKLRKAITQSQLTRTCAAQFCPRLHEPDREHCTLEWDLYARGTVGAVAADG